MKLNQIEMVHKLNKETGIGLILSRIVLEELEFDYDKALEYVNTDVFTNKYIFKK